MHQMKAASRDDHRMDADSARSPPPHPSATTSWLAYPPQDSGIQSKVPSVVNLNTIGLDESVAAETTASTSTAPSVYSDYANAKRVLPELVPLLEDDDEEVACRALEMVIHIAKLDAEQIYTESLITETRVIVALARVMRRDLPNKKLLRLSLCALFHISSRRDGMELIVAAFATGSHSTAAQRPLNSLLRDLVRAAGVHEMSCYKYALLLLHNLMTESSAARVAIDYIRTQKSLSVIVECLAERNEKLLSVVVDLIQLACDRNSEQKAFFIALNGPQHLSAILSWAQYENLLWRATRLMKSAAIYDPHRVAASGVLDVLPMHVDSSSPRLLAELLCCARDLSDVSLPSRDNSGLLNWIIHVFGNTVANDVQVRLYCVQALANLSANNARNKELMCSVNVIVGLKQVLVDAAAFVERNVNERTRRLLWDLEESALTALRNLCSGHIGERECQQQILVAGGSRLLYTQLLQSRPSVVRRALLILAKIAGDEEGARGLLLADNFPQSIGSELVQRLVAILHSTMDRLCEENHQPDREENAPQMMQLAMNVLEKVMATDLALIREVYTSFASRSLSCAEANQPTPTLLPLVLLSLQNRSITEATVGVVAELSRLDEMAVYLGQNRMSLSILRSLAEIDGNIGCRSRDALKFAEMAWSRQSPHHRSPSIQPPPLPSLAEPAATAAGESLHRNTRENSPMCDLMDGVMAEDSGYASNSFEMNSLRSPLDEERPLGTLRASPSSPMDSDDRRRCPPQLRGFSNAKAALERYATELAAAQAAHSAKLAAQPGPSAEGTQNSMGNPRQPLSAQSRSHSNTPMDEEATLSFENYPTTSLDPFKAAQMSKSIKTMKPGGYPMDPMASSGFPNRFTADYRSPMTDPQLPTSRLPYLATFERKRSSLSRNSPPRAMASPKINGQSKGNPNPMSQSMSAADSFVYLNGNPKYKTSAAHPTQIDSNSQFHANPHYPNGQNFAAAPYPHRSANPHQRQFEAATLNHSSPLSHCPQNSPLPQIHNNGPMSVESVGIHSTGAQPLSGYPMGAVAYPTPQPPNGYPNNQMANFGNLTPANPYYPVDQRYPQFPHSASHRFQHFPSAHAIGLQSPKINGAAAYAEAAWPPHPPPQSPLWPEQRLGQSAAGLSASTPSGSTDRRSNESAYEMSAKEYFQPMDDFAFANAFCPESQYEPLANIDVRPEDFHTFG